MKLSILDLHGQHDLDLDLQKNAHFFLIFVVFFLIFVVFFLSSLFFFLSSVFFGGGHIRPKYPCENGVDLPNLAKRAFGGQMGPNVQKAMLLGSPSHQGLKN